MSVTTTLTGAQPNNYTFNRTLSDRVMYGYSIDDETGCTPGYTEFCSRVGVTEWAAPVDCLDKPVWRQLRRLTGDGYKPVIVKEATTGTWSAAGWTRTGTAQGLAEDARSVYDVENDYMAFGSFASSFTLQVMTLDLDTGNLVADSWWQVAQFTDRLTRTGAPDTLYTPDPQKVVRFDQVQGMIESITYPRDREHGQCPIYDDLFTWGLSAYRPYVADPYDALAEVLEAALEPGEKSGKKVSVATCVGCASVV